MNSYFVSDDFSTGTISVEKPKESKNKTQDKPLKKDYTTLSIGLQLTGNHRSINSQLKINPRVENKDFFGHKT